MTINSTYEPPRAAYNINGNAANHDQARQQHERPAKQINLMRGWPSPSFLPNHLLSNSAQNLLADPNLYTDALEYGLDKGYIPLRKGLASWLGRHYGVEPDFERICVTGGASQNIARILQCYADPAYTRAVWVIAPCFFLACSIFEDGGFAGKLRASPEDEEGLDIDELERRLEAFEGQESARGVVEPIKKSSKNPTKFYRHVIYAVPTCANPSGRTMTLRRREALVRLARKYDALIIADDVYDFLQWDADAQPTSERPAEMRLPRLVDIDRAMGQSENDPQGFGHAVSNGSFSKVAGPGLRTGWLEASRAFAHGLGQTGTTVSGGPPSHFTAAIMSGLVASGELEKRIDEYTRGAMQRRQKLMMDAIKQYLVPKGASCQDESLAGTNIKGGYFLWLRLPAGVSAKAFAAVAASEENVLIGAGGLFEVIGDDSARYDDYCRLCFTYMDEEDLIEAVQRLGALLERMRDDRVYSEQLTKEA